MSEALEQLNVSVSPLLPRHAALDESTSWQRALMRLQPHKLELQAKLGCPYMLMAPSDLPAGRPYSSVPSSSSSSAPV